MGSLENRRAIVYGLLVFLFESVGSFIELVDFRFSSFGF